MYYPIFFPFFFFKPNTRLFFSFSDFFSFRIFLFSRFFISYTGLTMMMMISGRLCELMIACSIAWKQPAALFRVLLDVYTDTISNLGGYNKKTAYLKSVTRIYTRASSLSSWLDSSQIIRSMATHMCVWMHLYVFLYIYMCIKYALCALLLYTLREMENLMDGRLVKYKYCYAHSPDMSVVG